MFVESTAKSNLATSTGMLEVSEMSSARDIINQSNQSPIMSVQSLVNKMYNPLDESDVDEFNALSLKFGLSVPSPCRADLINLRAADFSRNMCETCSANRVTNYACDKVELHVEGSRIKARRVPCSKPRSISVVDVSSIPRRFSNITGKSWNITNQNSNATNAAFNSITSGKGLYLFGNVGTGKTMLSCIIIIERAKFGKPSLFYTVTDLLEDLRDFDNSLARAEKLRKVKSVQCLVIDDLGAEYATDWVASTLFTILDARYKANLQTIINSNFALEGLRSRYKGYNGERLIRRISELCDVVKIN